MEHRMLGQTGLQAENLHGSARRSERWLPVSLNISK